MASPLGRGRVSSEVLGLLLATPGQELHTREIARRVDADAHPVQRALEQLVAAGLVQSRRLGNLRLWSIVEGSPLLPAIQDVVRQTTGIAEALRRRLGAMRGVQLAFLFGSYASGRDALGSDVDLFIVGEVNWNALSKDLAPVAAKLGREVNPVAWSVEEFAHPTPRQARFLRNILSEPRIWLVGDDSELERTRSSMGAAVVGSTTRHARPRGDGRRAIPAASRRTQRRARTT